MFYSVTCKNADCGKRFKIRGPLQPGIHKVGCPFCSVKMSVRINGTPNEVEAPKAAAAPAPSPALDEIRKKYEPALESLRSAHEKKQASLKGEYEKKLAALKDAFDRQSSKNEAEYSKAKAEIEAKMQEAIKVADTKQPEQKPRIIDNSAAPAKELAMKAETGKEGLRDKCPHCGQSLGLPKQDKPGTKQLRCPKCKGSIRVAYVMPHIPTFNYGVNNDDLLGVRGMSPNISAQSPAQMHADPKPARQPVQQPMPKRERAYLTASHKDSGRRIRFTSDGQGHLFGTPNPTTFQSSERAYLKIGLNTLGRYDIEIPSDISIDGNFDSRMSRCSTCIEVAPSPRGLQISITLRSAKNAVLCNNALMVANKKYILPYGSQIIMGETRFVLQREM